MGARLLCSLLRVTRLRLPRLAPSVFFIQSVVQFPCQLPNFPTGAPPAGAGRRVSAHAAAGLHFACVHRTQHHQPPGRLAGIRASRPSTAACTQQCCVLLKPTDLAPSLLLLLWQGPPQVMIGTAAAQGPIIYADVFTCDRGAVMQARAPPLRCHCPLRTPCCQALATASTPAPSAPPIDFAAWWI